MDEKLKTFLEENKDLIKENEWSTLYHFASNNHLEIALTDFLLDGLGQETMLDCFSEEGEIPAYAFYGCESLTNITIPDSVNTIGWAAFAGCSGLTSIEFAEPSSVVIVGDYAFSGCSGLTSITIPDSVTHIGRGAFDGCKYNVIFKCRRKVVTRDALNGFNGTYEFK